MTCTSIQDQLLELPVERFHTLQHLRTCTECAQIAEELRVGQAAVAMELNAYVAGGDFDDAFQRARRTRLARSATVPVHGMLVAATVVAVLALISASQLPSWWAAGNIPIPKVEGLQVLDGKTLAELEAIAIASRQKDALAFKAWRDVGLAARLVGDEVAYQGAVMRAANLASYEPRFNELVEDEALLGAIVAAMEIDVKIINPHGAAVSLGELQIQETQVSTTIKASLLPANLEINNQSCKTGIWPLGTLEVHVGRESTTVDIDDGQVTECVLAGGAPRQVWRDYQPVIALTDGGGEGPSKACDELFASMQTGAGPKTATSRFDLAVCRARYGRYDAARRDLMPLYFELIREETGDAARPRDRIYRLETVSRWREWVMAADAWQNGRGGVTEDQLRAMRITVFADSMKWLQHCKHSGLPTADPRWLCRASADIQEICQ